MKVEMVLEIERCIPLEDKKLVCSYVWRRYEHYDAQDILDDILNNCKGGTT